jgi:hypothetical protein
MLTVQHPQVSNLEELYRKRVSIASILEVYMTRMNQTIVFLYLKVKYETHIELRSLQKPNARFILAMYLRLPATVETTDSSVCHSVDWLAHLLGASRLHQFCSRMNIEELNRTFPEKEWSGEDFLLEPWLTLEFLRQNSNF